MPELVGLGQLLGVGPKRMRELAGALGVRTTDEFRAAVAEGRLQLGAGRRPEDGGEAAVPGLERAGKPKPRRGLLLNRAWALAGGVAEALGGEVAGDPRRWKDSSEDFAVVVVADESRVDARCVRGADADRLGCRARRVARDRRHGRGRAGRARRFARPESFGTVARARDRLADYVRALEPLPAGAPDEAGVYAALGMPWCPPELRERRIATSRRRSCSALDDVRGDLHVHTTWSDGKASVLEMGEAAIALGYEYVAICDHTMNVRVVPGLDADAVRRQGEEIAEANERLAPVPRAARDRVRHSPDGSLDLPTTCSPSSTGCSCRSTRASARPGRS